MAKLQIKDLDFREVFLSSYKELGLNDNQALIILQIDSLTKIEPCLITGAILNRRMNLDEKTIEEEMVTLMNKKWLSYETVNGIMVTSTSLTYQKVIDFVLQDDESSKEIEESDDFAKVLRTLEEAMKRSLSSLEVELVSTWFKDGVDVKKILSTIEETTLKGNVTVKKVDRNLLKNLANEDIDKEGYTTIDEKTRKDINKTMDILSYDWVKNEK